MKIEHNVARIWVDKFDYQYKNCDNRSLSFQRSAPASSQTI